MMITKESQGFTLIEVMVALAIMAIAFIALCGLHISSFKTDHRNRNESRALFLANQKLEELRTQDFSSISGGTDLTVAPYDVTWTVTTDSWRKNIVVVVSWPERIKSMDGSNQDHLRSAQVATIIVDLN